MHYRSDIQILRGISVVLVVLFHIGFEQFSSGFLGVDVFFVISGFLMAILYNSNGIMKFFQRRALRLLPSYYVVIVVTVLLSFLLTTRQETTQVVEQAVWASAFASNIGFWGQADYFSTGDFNPLLHLWSLGVEIQFYLLVPVIVFFMRKHNVWLFIFFGVSLLACFVLLSVSPKTAFFLTPFRIWQFLLGFVVAKYLTAGGNIKAPLGKPLRALGFLGLLLVIMIPLVPVDGKSLNVISGHPGLFSLLISLATASVLVFGVPAIVEKSGIGNVLQTLGKYSYSIYLTHFPIIVLYNSQPFQGTVYGTESTYDLLIILSLIFASSFALYKLVECKGVSFKLKKYWRTSISVASISVVGLSVALTNIQLLTLSPLEKRIFAAEDDRPTYRCGMLFRAFNPRENICELTGIESEARILLAGNSHADSLKGVLSEVAKQHDYQVYFYRPGNTMNISGPSPARIVKDATDLGVNYIVVHQSAMAFDLNTLKALINAAASANIQVGYIEPVPVWREPIPSYLYSTVNNKDSKLLWKSIDDYYAENENIFSALETIEASNFDRISVAQAFCSPFCAFQSAEGILYYFDRHHLTLTGSELFRPAVESWIVNISNQ